MSSVLFTQSNIWNIARPLIITAISILTSLCFLYWHLIFSDDASFVSCWCRKNEKALEIE